MTRYDIFDVGEFEELDPETMGTKVRHWYRVPEGVSGCEAGSIWLLKVPTRFDGEVWSEKLTAEIAARMGLPAAKVELAVHHADNGREERGTICRSFVDIEAGFSLEHGNQLMEGQFYRGDYVLDEEGQVGLDAVYDCLDVYDVAAPLNARDKSEDGAFFFTGYLVLDALIGNVDRHHQNWGAVVQQRGDLYLAPTFDHGASLGRELGDRKRGNYLDNKQIDVYANKSGARAKIAVPERGERTQPYRLLEHLPQLGRSEALDYWLTRAVDFDDAALVELLDRFPEGTMSEREQEFVRAFCQYTRGQLAELQEDIGQ